MPELPTGTVTFLFSDIEGSTKVLLRLGEQYPEALSAHQRLLRQAWAEHAGVEIDTQGDSFFVVFARATDALAAAAQAQRALAEYAWPPDGVVRVRMGLHTGVGTLHDGHYVGIDVHRAARIAAAGHGGQVLLSHATRDQVARELVAGAGLRDLGRHRLKDLPRREEIWQLVLPGMPAEYPPLKTLDAWPGYRADLVAVVLLGAVLVAAVGLLLPAFVPGFPPGIGLGAAGLAALLLVSSAAARPVRRALAGQWRDARKPFAATTSALLCAVVVTTTLFITKPPIFVRAAPPLYDFSYAPHAPTHTGGAITIGTWISPQTLTPYAANAATPEVLFGLWQACLVQLPDVSLGLASFKPDQCTRVPTVDNGDESPDFRSTTFHIDPRAVWSDGMPVTADDYVFAYRLFADPNVGDGLPVSGTAVAVDPHTVRIDWSVGYGDYLATLIRVQPIPLHVYATGQFARVFDAKTGAYDSALAQQLVQSAAFITQVPPVDDGPFAAQSFVPGHQAVLVRNPRFFSNFFHHPAALDRVTFITANPQWPQGISHSQSEDVLVAQYRQGTVDLADWLEPLVLRRLGGIPKSQVVTAPLNQFLDIGFNQRDVAPNAQANGGVSIFSDPNVRKAFVEAFDRCGAVRAQLGDVNCADPNLFTNELTAPPAPDYDRTVTLPAYNPDAAARLMDRAGFPVVDGVRRYKDGKTPLQLTIDMSPGAAGSTVVLSRMQQDYGRNLKVYVTLDSLPGFFGLPDAPARIQTGAFDISVVGDQGDSDPLFNEMDILGPTDAKDIPSAKNPFGPDYLGIVDPMVVQQTHLGAETTDVEQRASIYRDLQRHVAQQFYIEPLYIIASVSLVRPTLCNFKAITHAGVNLWNMADWYVAPSCPT